MQIKEFTADAIKANSKVYGADNGAIKLIDDYFISQSWNTLTIEQHKAIALLIRYRNHFLNDNEAYDKRTKKTSYEHVGQTSIYDFMEADTAMQFQKVILFWSKDPIRYEYTNSRLKKSVRGVDDTHIEAVRLIHPLLIANPQLKQKRQQKPPRERALNNVFDSEEETIFDEVKQG